MVDYDILFGSSTADEYEGFLNTTDDTFVYSVIIIITHFDNENDETIDGVHFCTYIRSV